MDDRQADQGASHETLTLMDVLFNLEQPPHPTAGGGIALLLNTEYLASARKDTVQEGILCAAKGKPRGQPLSATPVAPPDGVNEPFEPWSSFKSASSLVAAPAASSQQTSGSNRTAKPQRGHVQEKKRENNRKAMRRYRQKQKVSRGHSSS